MASAFSHTTHLLTGEQPWRKLVWLCLTAIFLCLWGAWFFYAKFTLYEVSQSATLEVAQATHTLEAEVSGRLTAIHVVLGQEVTAGTILLELDNREIRLQLEEEKAKLTARNRRNETLQNEIQAQEQAKQDRQQTARVTIKEAQARHREAEASASYAAADAERAQQLKTRQHLSELGLLQTQSEAKKLRAAADALKLAISRQEWEQRTTESNLRAELARTQSEIARVEGDIAASEKAIERLQHTLQQHQIRTPVTGTIDELANLSIGTFVHQGDRLGIVVPVGDFTAIAYFDPATSLGRIRPGQQARLRLHGFPWTQYGSLPGTVSRIAREVGSSNLRVELAVHPEPTSAIPLQHGLGGVVEVAVEQVAPAELILRLAGGRFMASENQNTPQPNHEH